LLRYLAKQHKITVISLKGLDENSDAEILSNFVEKLVAVPFNPETIEPTLRNRIKSWTQIFFDASPRYANTYPLADLLKAMESELEIDPPDLIHVDMLFSAPLIEGVGAVPCILSQHNVEGQNRQRWAGNRRTWFQRSLLGIDAAKLNRWERHWLGRYKACIAVSKEDADYFKCYTPGQRVFVVPNGVDLEAFSPEPMLEVERSGVIFFGTLGYEPNSQAVVHFCKNILPLITKEKADVRLTILGQQAPGEVIELGKTSGVDYEGFVEDVRPYLWRSSVCVVPLKSGGGTRFKIIESLAAGCPVVSTSVGAEGLGLENQSEYLEANTDEVFARRVLELLNDPLRGNELVENGQAAIRQRFAWSIVAPKLEQAYLQLLNQYPKT
jgi:glycosyltransferase involved in cell wall biosynthesis